MAVDENDAEQSSWLVGLKSDTEEQRGPCGWRTGQIRDASRPSQGEQLFGRSRFQLPQSVKVEAKLHSLSLRLPRLVYYLSEPSSTSTL